MPLITDFSGVLTVAAPGAVAANNAAGKDIIVQANHFLSLGPVALNGTTAQNELILAIPKFAYGPKVIRNAVKTAGQAWVAGQSVYLVAADGSYTTTKLAGLVGGIAFAGAAAADVVGDVLPCTPNVVTV